MSGDVLAKANRLRETLGLPVGVELMDMCGDAAVEIERLRADLAIAADGLQQLAAWVMDLDPDPGDSALEYIAHSPDAPAAAATVLRRLLGEADDER